MTDWKQIARQRGTRLEGADLEMVTGPLEALEKQFRALEGEIRLETEPAAFYVVPGGEDQA